MQYDMIDWPAMALVNQKAPGDPLLTSIGGNVANLSGFTPGRFAAATLAAWGSPTTAVHPDAPGFFEGGDSWLARVFGGPVDTLKTEAKAYTFSGVVLVVSILLLVLALWALLRD